MDPNGSYSTPMPHRRSDAHRSLSQRNMSQEIEQVVTDLLRTTRTLLEALNMWSQLRTSTSDIFDIHRTLEAQFYRVTHAFDEAGIDTSDLAWIPNQLGQSVTDCMNQEASPATLDQHLPRIRDVIVHLLHGLKAKQQKHREQDAHQQQQQLLQQQQQQQHWHRSSMSSASGDSSRASPTRSYDPRMSTSSAAGGGGYGGGGSGGSSSATPPAPRSNYDPYTSGMPKPTVGPDGTKYYNNPPPARAQTYSPPPPPTPTKDALRPSMSMPRRPAYTQSPPMAPAAPNPANSPNRSDFDESDPNTASALAALKRQENLARRSSVRRASMYRGNTSADYASKRFMHDAPPLPTSTSTPMARLDEEPARRTSAQANAVPFSAQQQQQQQTPPAQQQQQQLQKQSQPQPHQRPPAQLHEASPAERASNAPSTAPSKENGLTLFLKIDDQVKKVVYTGDITLPALSMLFIERFGYSAGQHDFPSIYISDPSGQGIAYELQDLTDVVDRSILSLNTKKEVEESKPAWVDTLVVHLDTMKKEHDASRAWMGEQLGLLKEELASKTSAADLKATQELLQQAISTNAAIASAPAAPAAAAAAAAAAAPETVESSGPKGVPPPPPPPPPPMVDTTQLKSLQQQVEKLQRDIMVLRQTQTELEQDKKRVQQQLDDKSKAYTELEQQSKQAVLKPSSPSQARQFIEDGKTKLLTSSDKITTRLEDLQDMIDHIKLDVTQRKCRPSQAQMQHCDDERKSLGEEIDAFGKYIAQVKPVWKKTWEQELQNIVKEQQALKEQEGLLLDMNDDLEALQEVYEQLEKICAYQAKAKPQLREFQVKPAEEGHEGMSSVLRQIATIDVDNDRRLKALEMADKMRQREIANRIDDFERELTSFVDHKKLKKTGGAAEIDRLRQEKDKEMLQQIYAKKDGSAAPPTTTDNDASPASPTPTTPAQQDAIEAADDAPQADD
ncbi:actin interacting protein 3-domain-containing protein [Gongronella butleri]|nr:actin interacting protein 3-domain-containing protein [Gongronella butleri]